MALERNGFCFAQQHVGGDAQAVVESANHREGQGPFPVEDLGYAAAAAKERNQVLRAEVLLLQAKTDCFNRFRRRDGSVPFFVNFNQRTEELKLLASGRSGRASMSSSTRSSAERYSRRVLMSLFAIIPSPT